MEPSAATAAPSTQPHPATSTPASRNTAKAMKLRKLEELEARVKLSERKLDLAAVELSLVRKRLELLQLTDDDDFDWVIEEPGDDPKKKSGLVKKHQEKTASGDGALPETSLAVVEPEVSVDESRILAEAIVKAMRWIPETEAASPDYMYEPPNSDKWLFSEIGSVAQNKEILYSEINKIKTLPRLADDLSNIFDIQCKVFVAVRVMQNLKEEEYLKCPEYVKNVVQKLTPVLKNPL